RRPLLLPYPTLFRSDAREISRGDALVRYPRQQIPAAAVCVVLFVRDADHSLAPARRGSERRSFSRAWNIRVFTVFTGHFMISARSEEHTSELQSREN